MIFLENIQDSLSTKDTTKVFKAYKLTPAIKKDIKSDEGAIIPKEAVSMIKLVPSTPVEEQVSTPISTYILIGLSFVVAFLLIRTLLKRRKSE